MYISLFQEEPGASLDTAGGEDDRLNGASGSSSSAALHHSAGPKKRRHRIPRQEKDRDQQVREDLITHSDVFDKLLSYYNVLGVPSLFYIWGQQ